MMNKRVISLFLLISFLVVAVFSPYAIVLASEQKLTPNMDFLDAILSGERQWVRDTLVYDDRSTNPLADLMGSANDQSLARSAINKYYGIGAEDETYAAVYRYGVSVLNLVYTPEEVVRDVVDEAGNLLSWIASFFAGTESLQKFLDDMVASADELGYDKILKEAFSKEYTSSTGMTLGDSEASYVFLQGLIDACDMLNKLKDALTSDAGVGKDPKIPRIEYIEKYVLPYQDSLEALLNEIPSVVGKEKNLDYSKFVTVASLLSAVSYYQQSKPLYGYRDYVTPYNEQVMESIVDDYTADILKKGGKVIDFASTSLDTYIYLQSIQHQREALTGPVSRLRGFANGEDMQKSFDNFNDLLNAKLDEKTIAYESIVTYLREEDVVGDAATKLVKGIFKKTNLYKNNFLSSSALSKSLATIGVATWMGDKVTGIENTCKKTSLLLRWDDIMSAAVQSYRQSEDAYLKNRTEENAKTVIEDLQMLQRLRLYGETIAYELTAGQFESWFGQFYCGHTTSEAWTDIYQRSVDVLIASSPIPPMSGLNIEGGDHAYLMENDDVGLYISTDKGRIVDAATLLMGGVTCNNGTLVVTAPVSRLGTIQTSGNSVVILGSSLSVEDYWQKDGTTAVKLGTNGSFTAKNVTLKGSITEGRIRVEGNVDASGGGSVSNLELTDSGPHTISGTLAANNLYMMGGTVQLNGAVTVTDTLYGPTVEIENPENLLLSGGTVSGGTYPALLKVKNAYLSNTVFQDALTDQGGTTYAGTTTVQGIYRASGTSTIQSGGAVRVMTDSDLTNATLNGLGRLELHGDAILTGSNCSNLYVNGVLPQTISGTATVKNLYLQNEHVKGVTLTDEITITDTLYEPIGAVTATENLVLTGNAEVSENVFEGDLSFRDWTCSTPLTITGNARISGSTMANTRLTVRGDVTLPDATALTNTQLTTQGNVTMSGASSLTNTQLTAQGNVTLSRSIPLRDSTINSNSTLSGAFSLVGSHVTAANLRSTAALTVDEASSLNVGSASLNGSLLCNGPVVVRNDCVTNSVTTSGAYPFSCGGELTVSGTTHFHHLLLNSQLAQNISGSSFTVDTLEFRNTSPKGVTVSTDVTVQTDYLPHNTVVQGADHIISSGKIDGTRMVWGDTVIEEDTHVTGDLYLNGDLTITDASLTVDGNVYWSGGAMTVTNAGLTVDGQMHWDGGALTAADAALTISDRLHWNRSNITLTRSKLTLNEALSCSGSSRTLTVDAGSEMTVGQWAKLSSVTAKLDGVLTLGSDCVLTSAPISGSGSLRLRGDLSAGSSSVNVGAFELIGKLPQTVSGSGSFKTGDITLDNPSRVGITFQNTIYYSGTLDAGTGVVTGLDKLISEVA